MSLEHAKGRNVGNIMLYALSTCGWCRKTRDLLNSLGAEYDYIYVDLLPENERDDIMKTVQKWNPSSSFPTIVINNKPIVGFKEDEIRKALNL
jgi:glutaredoxin-like protein NrdH